jgi:hypothetical protein
MQNYLSGIAHHRMELTGLTGGADNSINLPSDVTRFVDGLDYEVIVVEGNAWTKKGSKTNALFIITTAASVTAVTLIILPHHPPHATHIE